MTRNSARIRSGIAALCGRPYEIISGKVVAGSIDTSAHTMDVQPFNSSIPIEKVLLTAVAEMDNGMILIPAEGSHVIVGSIDGPGQWTLLNASELTKAIIKIGDVQCVVTEDGVKLEHGSTVLDIGTLIKLNTASESLFSILNDLVTAISLITVNTSGVPSTVPINAASFTALLPRLNNLLSA